MSQDAVLQLRIAKDRKRRWTAAARRAHKGLSEWVRQFGDAAAQGLLDLDELASQRRVLRRGLNAAMAALQSQDVATVRQCLQTALHLVDEMDGGGR